MNVRNLKGFIRTPGNLGLIAFLAAAAYFLLAEHRAHAIAALPYALVGGCLLMVVFMHRRHGHGRHPERKDGQVSHHLPDAGDHGEVVSPVNAATNKHNRPF